MVFIQKPNRLLLIAIGGFISGKVTTGILHRLSESVFIVSLAIWAYEEARSGVNWFRRVLGIGVLFLIVFLLTSNSGKGS